MENKTPFPGGREVFLLLWGIFTLYLMCVLLVGGGMTPWRLVLYESVIVLPPILYVFYRGYPLTKVFRLHRVSLWSIFFSALVGLGCYLVSHAWDLVVQKRFPMHPELYEGLNRIMGVSSSETWFPVFLSAIFLAGVGEEMLFRGLFQGTVERIGGKVKGIFYPAWIFVFLHFNPWWALPLLVMGILAGWVAWRSQSVYPAMALHMMVNGVSLLRLHTRWLSEVVTHPAMSRPDLIFGLGVLFVVIGLLLFRPCVDAKKRGVPLPKSENRSSSTPSLSCEAPGSMGHESVERRS